MYRGLALGVLALHTWQIKVSPHQILLAARERLYIPHNTILFRYIFTIAIRGLKLGAVSVRRHGHNDFHIVGRAPLLELTLGLDHVFDARMTVSFDHGLDPEQRLHLGIQPVRHELKVAIGRYERDRAIVLESRQAHTLMKLDVLELHCLVLST